MQPHTRTRLRWEAALVGVTLVWGSTFVLVKDATTRLPVYTFNGTRFLLAAAVLAVFCLPALRRLGPVGWRRGAVLGTLLFGAYAFQTVGLQYTTASRAGFITGTMVVLTPLLSAVLLRRVPSPPALTGVVLATTGLGLLSLRGSLAPAYGDVLVLACALSFALHLVGLGAWSKHHPPLPLAVVQLAVAGVLHSSVALVSEIGVEPAKWDVSVLAALLITALLASAAAFWIQTAAQQVVSPTRTAIILTLEPVFAGVFGYLLLGERLDGRGWLGAALILAGMLVAELRAQPGTPASDDRPQAGVLTYSADRGP